MDKKQYTSHRRCLRFIIWLSIFISFIFTPILQAQELDWREHRTTNFAILYTPDNTVEIEHYAGFVDDIYEEIATIFNHRTATPIILRLYPTLESYYQINPLARNIGGIVAHADSRRREVVIIIEQTRIQRPEEVPNNVRHELTHIIAAELSNNHLNTGFQEGIAQYIEHAPTDILQQKAQLVNLARDQGTLLSWSDLDDRDKMYSKPEISYPQTLSIVAFLIESYGFGKFREFLVTVANSSGYRIPLEQTYGVSSTVLEEQWRNWLPSYLNGGYNHNALTNYDLSYLRDLLTQGHYAEAETQLEQVNAWLSQHADTQSAETLANAQQLLEYSRAGQKAEQLAMAARTALEQTDYEQAHRLLTQARETYTNIGDTRQDEILAVYAERITRGLNASEQLRQAFQLVREFRLLRAREEIDAAVKEFAALGDQQRMESALLLRHSIDERQRSSAFFLIAFGVIGLCIGLWNGLLRRYKEHW